MGVTVFELSRTVLVNDDPSQPRLSRADVWAGLVMKADNALPFVPQMRRCDVVERGDGWLVRDILLSGDVGLRERVTFEPGRRVVFERIGGSEPGRIENTIGEDADGNLTLTFAFGLSKQGIAPGSVAELEHFKPMEAAYFGAVASTLAAVRRLVAERGAAELEARHDPAFCGNPQWLFDYYDAADALDLGRLLQLHSDDCALSFGSFPALRGQAALREMLSQFWRRLKQMSHQVTGAWSLNDDRVGVVEAIVTYRRTDDSSLSVRSCSTLRRVDGKVVDMRVHADMSGL
jgi:ketosteroid isomerase-like protein